MKIKLYPFIILLLTVLFVQCTSSTEKENKTADLKTTTDTLSVTDQVDSVATIMKSEITCPKCGNKKMETMPTDVCLIKYKCEKCAATLFPKDGDCCVFCTYGTHKCPSKQS